MTHLRSQDGDTSFGGQARLRSQDGDTSFGGQACHPSSQDGDTSFGPSAGSGPSRAPSRDGAAGSDAEMADAEARELIATGLDDTLVVEAAAGTGKTTELVGRIVRILAEGCTRVDKIVAVTFTEKAAGELKLRLRERLDRERTTIQDERARRQLDLALTQLEEAHISTIHGFCADLLRERPVEASIDPLFEVLTEPASARVFDDAFGRWLQEQLADPPEGVRRALRRTAFGGNDGPIDRLRNAAWELTGWRDFTGDWTRNPFDREGAINDTVSLLHEVADLTRSPSSRNDPLCTSTEPARRLSDEIRLQQEFGDSGRPDYDGWEAGLVDLSRDRGLGNVRHGRGALYKDGVRRDTVLNAVEELRSRLDQFRMDADADLAALLQRELRGATARYETLKSAAGALDFLDLLVRARDLVRGNPLVRRGFQERFTHIFVDEFQDTDPLQAEILLLLSADDTTETDWRRVRPVPGRLFLVGDPKQSIYRFRRADVGIYREVSRQLERHGARLLRLNTSFRSVPEIQACVNRAFAPVMTGDELTLQAPYVALAPFRSGRPGQPAVVVLPVPSPYATRYLAGSAIDKSLPGAVGAMVDWIVNQSGWKVTERSGTAPVPVTAKHICLLFRRFVSWQTDVTRPYVEALEARGIPHVLVGGRAFHEREEIEAIRAALAAVEWPDDELSVFAALRGPFFAITDEDLLDWAYRFGRKTENGFRRYAFHPHRIPDVFARDTPSEVEHLRPIAGALQLLKRLHRHRNSVFADSTDTREWGGASGVLHELLRATRAHVGFALRIGGEQALANVLHVAELARQYELGGGISFRGFVEELRTAADTAQAAEAPILEEDSDGVRMMTVHKAKGLEFPVVILVDLTCKLSRAEAGRWIDPSGNLCAIKLGGWAPTDLLLNGAVEAARDRAEGQRLAYVAATRARDVLIVPAIGDDPYDGGWLDPLTPAIYPALSDRRKPSQAAGCPVFPSKDTVVSRPDGDPAKTTTVAPGKYSFDSPVKPPAMSEPPITESAPFDSASPRSGRHSTLVDDGESNGGPRTAYEVVWWDPHALALDAGTSFGLRRDDLIAKDGDAAGSARRLAAYRQWESERATAIGNARQPSIASRTVTQIAADHDLWDADSLPPKGGSHERIESPQQTRGFRLPPSPRLRRTAVASAEAGQAEGSIPIEVVDVPRVAGRPFGPQFGTLVHTTLATVPLDAEESMVRRVASTQARILLGSGSGVEEEAYAVAEAVMAVLRHPLFDQVRSASSSGRCYRELPLIWQAPDGTLIEGTIDLAFEESDRTSGEPRFVVLDFKTDRELEVEGERYRRQLAIYCQALMALRGGVARGILMRV
jgi:ATP-dependent exoDNAse (exonuclease V) beta subunit